MLCPVCKTEYGTDEYCTVCGFDDFRTEFLNKAEADLWRDTIVMPFFQEYCLRFSCQTRGRKLLKYIGTHDVVNIPSGIEIIGKLSFRHCRGIKQIILPTTIKEIQRRAFANQKQLQSITLPKSVELIEENAFDDLNIQISVEDSTCFRGNGYYLIDNRNDKLLWLYPNQSIPDGETIKIIGRCALDNLKIRHDGILTIPEGVEELSGIIIGSFAKRKKVKQINLPKTLIKIGKKALSGLNLDEIVLPPNLSYIGDFAFSSSSIKELYLPEAISFLGKNIVGNCKKLEKVTVSANNENYYSLNNCIVDTQKGSVVAFCKTSIIPTLNSVTDIADYAFWHFRGTEIFIPQNIRSISLYAFYEAGDIRVQVDPNNATFSSSSNCIIEKIKNGKVVFANDLSEIPLFVDAIGTGALSNRNKSIVIPQNITTIESQVFSDGLMSQDDDVEGNEYCWGYIFCETETMPTGWADDWLGESEAKVFWQSEWSYIDGAPMPIDKNI